MAEGGRNLRINPFIVAEDHIKTGEKWDEWLEELEQECDFSASAKQQIRRSGNTEIRKESDRSSGR